MPEPLLSICVPSRNRQAYLKPLVQALTASSRTDVEFVIVDNSDDPTIMDGFMAACRRDPRVRYLPSGDTVRSMMDNWEAAIGLSTGRFVTMIGDDDYCDPEAAGVIARILAADPEVEAIDWAKMQYSWPDGDKPADGGMVPLDTEIHPVERDLLVARAFRWQDAGLVLASGFTIYHGAVSRSLIDRIRAAYGGRFFEFPVVDYEALFKVIWHGRKFVHVRRPLSVLGACPLSNTVAARKTEDMLARLDVFNKETGTPLDRLPVFADFPFKTTLGMIAGIAMVHHWFCKRAGIDPGSFGSNLARAASAQVSAVADREEFDLLAGAWRRAFSRFERGRHIGHFQPVFTGKREGLPFRGVWKRFLYVEAGNPWCETCSDYYDFVGAALVPPASLAVDLGRYVAISHNDRRAAG